jgi:hypothetical protein
MKDLNSIAKAFFEQNKNVEKVYITTDGYVFVNKNAVDLHKQTAGKKLSVKTFDNTFIATSTEPKKTVEERIASINEAETVEAVEALLKGEKAKTVKEAGVAKIAELKTLAQSGQDTPETRGDDVTNDNVKTDN